MRIACPLPSRAPFLRYLKPEPTLPTPIQKCGVSAAESHKPETDKPETNTPEADTPEITTPEHNDQNREFVVASREVESLDVGHDQTDEAVRPAESPAIAVAEPLADADADAVDDDVRKSVDGL